MVSVGVSTIAKTKSTVNGRDENDEQRWPHAPASGQPPCGKALVAYRRARIVNRFDRRVAELEFTIIQTAETTDPTEWENAPVMLYCSLPLEGPAKRRGKYYALWTLANGAPPKRHGRMSPDVFAGYWWVELERTRQATKREGGVRPVEEHEGVTQIGRMIERDAGGPVALTTKITNAAPTLGKSKSLGEVR